MPAQAQAKPNVQPKSVRPHVAAVDAAHAAAEAPADLVVAADVAAAVAADKVAAEVDRAAVVAVRAVAVAKAVRVAHVTEKVATVSAVRDEAKAEASLSRT